MNGQDDAARTPRCPRCGYDVSGLPPTWETQCPLQSVCSECGIEFAWGDLLNPLLTMPRWLYEHPGRRGVRLGALISTTVRACFPWHFWRHVRLVHPAEPRRLAMLLGAWIIALYVGVLALGVAKVVFYRLWFDDDFYFWYDVIPFISWPRQMLRPLYIAVLLVHFLTPLAFMLLPDSRHRSRVRLIHVVRAAIYGMSGLAVVSLTRLIAGLLTEAAFHLSPSGSLLARIGGEGLGLLKPFWVLGVLVWVLTWWSFVTGRYMKMHMWPLVTLSIVVIGALSSFLLVLLVVLAPALL